MAELGLQGFPPAPIGVDLLTHYRSVLETVPEEFSTVWHQDHLQKGREPDLLEGWTILTHLATAFPRFRYGHLVLSQSFRNPALLAKMAATFQYVTGGRFVLSMGAGWLKDEYRAYGYDYPTGGVRVAQLAEAIQIIRAMWSGSPATFHGEHYHISGARLEVPPHDPIPIQVGTSGRQALRVTARHADWWNWDAPWEPTFRQPYEVLKAHCREIGRDIGEITLTAGAFVDMPTDPSTFEPRYFHSYYDAWFPLLGPTAGDVARELETLVDVGVEHLQLAFSTIDTFHRFIDEVIPILRLEPKSATRSMC